MAGRPLFPKMIKYVAHLVAGLLALVVGLLALGNPQWHRLIYQAQMGIFTTNIIPFDLLPPAHYSGTWTQWQRFPIHYPKRRFDCLHGELHGWITIYWQHGSKAVQFHVSHGVYDGPCYSWDEQGRLIARGIFAKGEPWDGTFTILPYGDQPVITFRDMGTGQKYGSYLDDPVEYRHGEFIGRREASPPRPN